MIEAIGSGLQGEYSIAMRLSYQVFALSFIVSAVALSLVGAHTVEEISKILNRQTLDTLKSRVERDAHAFEDVIHTMNSDLSLLSSTTPVQRLPSTWMPHARESMEKTVQGLFSTLMAQRPYYDQLRLIDPNGLELVRINKSNQGLEVVAKDALQNKSDRP